MVISLTVLESLSLLIGVVDRVSESGSLLVIISSQKLRIDIPEGLIE